MRGRILCAPLALPALCLGFGLENLPVGMQAPVVREMEATGYCSCGQCCRWTWSWHGFGNPVFSSGRRKGQRKDVGVTASGGPARIGTVAADTSVLPLGTVVYIAGFGWGRVEDRGSAVRGGRLDIWFDDHEKARRWGRRKVAVKAWLPVDARKSPAPQGG